MLTSMMQWMGSWSAGQDSSKVYNVIWPLAEDTVHMKVVLDGILYLLSLNFWIIFTVTHYLLVTTNDRLIEETLDAMIYVLLRDN